MFGWSPRRLTKCSAGLLACELTGRLAWFSFGFGGETPPKLAGEDACATLSVGQRGRLLDKRRNWSCLLGCALVTVAPVFAQRALSTDTSISEASQSIYKSPELITGSIYARDAEPARLLFKLKRTSTSSGAALKVLREYSYPDGRLAARERVTYQGNVLRVYELDELQTGGSGSVNIEGARADRIAFRYSKDASHSSLAIKTESLVGDLLVNDMVGPFLASHWAQLLRGEKVPCRYVVVPRKETVGFSFTKDSESTWRGHDVLIVKMQPTSLLISVLVDPLYFTIQKAPPHRVLRYIGRTTPKLSEGGRWKDLDATTVFDWQSAK